MKKILLLSIAILLVGSVYGQDNVSIYYGQTRSTFKYEDSEGSNDLHFRNQFRANYGVNFSKVFRSGLFLRPGIGFSNFGAVTDLYSQKLTWSLRYVDFNLGLGYIKRFGVIAPYIGVSPYISSLYDGTQTVGPDEYDLLKDEAIAKSDYGVNVFGGIKYFFTEAVAVYGEVKSTTGLMQLETTEGGSGQNQKLYNRAISIQIGLSLNMVNKRTAHLRSNF